VDAAACAYSGVCSDGAGYLSDTPAWCVAAIGPQQSFASASQVAAAMVGVWTSCGTTTANEFVRALDVGVGAGSIEFTRDGHFFLRALSRDTIPQDLTMKRLTGPSDTGTLEVVDASATLGPGTYQARLTALDGGVHVTQVLLFGSPARLRFFSPGADDYVHAYTNKYQANICGPGFGPVYRPADRNDLLSHLQGRWARCPNHPLDYLQEGITEGGVGLEFPGDGTWYALVEDEGGNLVRTTNPSQHGSLQPGGSYTLTFSTADSASEPLEPVLDECGGLAFTPSDVDPGSIFDGGPVEGGTLYLSYEYRRLP